MERSNERLKQELERTRARVAADVDAISERITPEQIKQQAKQSILEAKEHMKQRVKYEARRAGQNLAHSARANPMPLLLVGAGIGWLVYDARQRSRGGWREPGFDEIEGGYGTEAGGYAAHGDYGTERGGAAGRIEHVRERVGQVRERAGERLHQAREHAGERFRVVRDDTRAFVRENPLTAGAIALALGAGVGFLLPSTSPENRALGRRKDRLLERGREVLGEVADRATEKLGGASGGGEEIQPAGEQQQGALPQQQPTQEQSRAFDLYNPEDRQR
jgi:ElaB/YqjD/DUF883 family membrane-anchored ribosome-binding protein